MAILCSMKYLPPNATVRDCLEKYREIKLKEIDEIHQTISNAFVQRLQMLEDELLGDSEPIVSAQDGAGQNETNNLMIK